MTRISTRAPAVRNGLYATVEYVSQPLGMLLAAPYLLRHLGAAAFGVWVLASAAVNSGSLLSSGFGDAAVKYVSMYRGRGDAQGVAQVVRGMLTINLALGGIFAAALWCLAPFAALHLAHLPVVLSPVCVRSFRIGSVLLLVRSVDSVFASTLRACEYYAAAVRIAVAARVCSLITAVVLVACGFGVVEILQGTLCICALAIAAQALTVRALVGRFPLLPSLHAESLAPVARFGCFSWLQAVAAVLFSQADRLIIGFFLGTSAVAVYALCAQAAQTIHGALAAGFHALFPHLSARMETESPAVLRRTVVRALRINAVLALTLGTGAALCSRMLLTIWMGRAFAQESWAIFVILAAAYALFALNVTAYYALLAAGRVRLVTAANLAAGFAMLLLMLLLTPAHGMVGTACARLIAGPITCLLYVPLAKMLRSESPRSITKPEPVVWEDEVCL